jgi:hypothetical protein
MKAHGSVSSGRAYRQGKYWTTTNNVTFYNQHPLLLNKANQIMKEIGLNTNIRKGDNDFFITASSMLFLEFYRKFDLKSLSGNLLLAFIRGFYDGQGNYYYESGLKNPYVTIQESNEKVARFLFDRICGLGFRPQIYKIRRGKTAFKEGFTFFIHIRRKGEAEDFIEMIKPLTKNIPSNKWF